MATKAPRTGRQALVKLRTVTAGELAGSAGARRPADRVDERLVDEAVAHLRKLVVVGQVETLVEVGEYLIEKFYGGIDNALSRSPIKAASLERLAERSGEFGMSAATLRYVIPLTAAAREIGLPLAGRLGVSRLRAILPVKDGTQRKLLAETAVATGLTVDKLESRVRRIARPHAGGRPRSSAIDRLVAGIERVVESTGGGAGLRDGIETLGATEARRLLGRLNRIQAELERAEKLLQKAAIDAARAEQPK
jgi:hypothetical protein